MDFGFNDEQEALRQSAREVLADKAGPAVYRAAMATKTGTDDALWTTIGELGWAGVAIDEQHGGLGLGLIELTILMEETGRALAPVPFFSTVALAGQLLEQASGSARDEALRAIASGGARATAALGQKDGRYDAAGVSVKAARTENGWKFSGTASLVPEAHLADQIVVLARTARARVCARAHAVRSADRQLPGDQPQVRRHAARHGNGAFARVLRGLGARRGRTRRAFGRGDGEGGGVRRRAHRGQRLDPGPRRHRLHVGARDASVLSAREVLRAVPRRRIRVA